MLGSLAKGILSQNAGETSGLSFPLENYTSTLLHAYSLRNLLPDVSFVVQDQSSNDRSAEYLISPEALTDYSGSDLNAFIWYDQSGNGYNLVAPSSLRGPQVISGGSLNTYNGNPVLVSDGNYDTLNNFDVPTQGAGNRTAICVCKFVEEQYGAIYKYGSPNTSSSRIGLQTHTPLRLNYNGSSLTGAPNNTYFIVTIMANDSLTNVRYWINEVEGIDSPLAGTNSGDNGLKLFARTANFNTSKTNETAQVNILEFVAWDSDMSGDLPDILSEMATYYGIS